MAGRLQGRRRRGRPGAGRRPERRRRASPGPATRSSGRWRAATPAPSAACSTRPRSGCRSARSSSAASSTSAASRRDRPPRPARARSASASRTSSSTAATSASRCRSPTRSSLYLLARMLWIGFRGRGEGLRPSAPDALARRGDGLPARLPARAQRRRLGRDRRRLRGGDRRRPARPRRPDLRRGRVPGRQPLRRHLRPGRTTSPTCRSSWPALERRVGRAARRPRRRDLLRPRHRRRPLLLGRPAAPGRRAAASSGRSWPSPGPPSRTRRSRSPSNTNDSLVAALIAGRSSCSPRRSPAARCSRWRSGSSSPRSRSRRCTRPAIARFRARAARGFARRRAAVALHRRPRRRHRPAPRPPGDRPRAWPPSTSARSRARSTAPRRSASGARPTSTGCTSPSSSFAARPRRRWSPSPRSSAPSPSSPPSPPRSLIAVQLTADHWFYLYIVWFFPPLIAALVMLGRDEPKEVPGPLTIDGEQDLLDRAARARRRRSPPPRPSPRRPRSRSRSGSASASGTPAAPAPSSPPMTPSREPVMPTSEMWAVPPGRTRASAVGTWVWVPQTAATRPSRCQPIATFSLVTSAWKSTTKTSASSLEALEQGVGLVEGRARGVEVDRAR